MSEKLTDWIPIETPPVRDGEYDVRVPMTLFKDEFEEIRAEWSEKNGQRGFWVTSKPHLNTTQQRLVSPVSWRGRLIIERRKLNILADPQTGQTFKGIARRQLTVR